MESGLGGRQKAVKTVYDGIKTVAVQAVKAIAEGAHFIWQKIGGLADSVKRLMFTVRDRVKGALAAFQQRLSALADFFVHREVVTVGDGHAAFTKFDADFDVINYFPGPPASFLSRSIWISCVKRSGTFSCRARLWRG